MERLLESVSFDASERASSSLRIDSAYVDQHLADLAKANPNLTIPAVPTDIPDTSDTTATPTPTPTPGS